MVTTKDIVAAVNKKIKACVPNAKIKSTDFRKKVEPGTFYTEYPNPTINSTKNLRHEEGTVRVYYFPQDDNQSRYEFAEMLNTLSTSFLNTISVNDTFAIPITELEFNIIDNVLNMSFDYETWQYIEDSGVAMENLYIR